MDEDKSEHEPGESPGRSVTPERGQHPASGPPAAPQQCGTNEPVPWWRDTPRLAAYGTLVLAAMALWQAIIGTKNIGVARRNITAAERSLELSQRAWMVAVRMKDMDLAPGAEATVELTNTGRVPALHAFMQAQLTAAPVGKELPLPPPYKPPPLPMALAAIGPNQPVTLGDKLEGDVVQGLGDVRASARKLYFYGYVIYWDDFLIQRGLIFCGRYDLAKKNFVFCPYYNHAW
jgi:hypothetical protein